MTEELENPQNEQSLSLVGGIVIGVILVLVILISANWRPAPFRRAEDESTRAKVRKWAEALDKKTTPEGAYVRHDGEALPETDSWGTALQVAYLNDALAESLIVRSAGPDKSFFTNDDIEERRMTGNMTGGLKQLETNAAGIAEKAATGAVKGTVEGIKQAVKEVKDAVPKDKLKIPFGKKKPEAEAPEEGTAEK